MQKKWKITAQNHLKEKKQLRHLTQEGWTECVVKVLIIEKVAQWGTDPQLFLAGAEGEQRVDLKANGNFMCLALQPRFLPHAPSRYSLKYKT